MPVRDPMPMIFLPVTIKSGQAFTTGTSFINKGAPAIMWPGYMHLGTQPEVH